MPQIKICATSIFTKSCSSLAVATACHPDRSSYKWCNNIWLHKAMQSVQLYTFTLSHM